jgi:hypothetical protein
VDPAQEMDDLIDITTINPLSTNHFAFEHTDRFCNQTPLMLLVGRNLATTDSVLLVLVLVLVLAVDSHHDISHSQ